MAYNDPPFHPQKGTLMSEQPVENTDETQTEESFAVTIGKVVALNVASIAATFGTIALIGTVSDKLAARKAKKDALPTEE